MHHLRQGIDRHRTSLLVGALSFGVYLGLALLFFSLMGIHNPWLLRASRTLGTTLLTWVVMTVVMHSVYGGFDVGRKKNKPVISAMFLSVLFTDTVSYLQLQIMNTNENNNARLTLFGRDFPLLLLCMVLQAVCIILYVKAGNAVYFHINPPQKCLLVLFSPDQQDHILQKINRYRLQWRVDRIVTVNNLELDKEIQAAETVILGPLPAQWQMELLRACYHHGKNVMCNAVLEDIVISNARQAVVDDAPFLDIEFHKMSFGQRVIKRVGDIVISLLGLIVLSPLMGIVALMIRAEDHGPVLFRQDRVTIRGRIFRICKFRTMTVAASEDDHPISAQEADARVTRIGRFLRRWRIDELPQLWNILQGDMTIVGPRPEMVPNVEKYKRELPDFIYREKMKAGLTGYAQIEGRYNTTPEDKLMLDLMYIENFSVWLDIKLIFRTLMVFFKSSSSTEGFAAGSAGAPGTEPAGPESGPAEDGAGAPSGHRRRGKISHEEAAQQ